MSPYYYNDIPVNAFDDETALVVLGIMLVILALIAVVSVVFWVFWSLGLYKIAKRRGIRSPWLAWIPVGNQWILGSVSDQYQHLIQGKVTSRRKILLILNAVGMAVGVGSGILTVLQAIAAQTDVGVVAFGLIGMLVPLLTWGVGVTVMVFSHICSYDLYRSCDPKNAVVFLVLGILLPVCEPFFYFSCRKKDLGMVVPRTDMPEPAELPKAGPEF